MNRPNEMSPARDKSHYQSPLRTLVILGLSLFAAEYVVMHALPFFPQFRPWIHYLLDSTLMILLSFPALYYLVLRPLRQHLREHQRNATELRRQREQLEKEIEVRRSAEKELMEAELRYRTVADFTHDWEYWVGQDGAFRYCSPSCERITGYSAAEFIADPMLLHRIVHPEDSATWQAHHCDGFQGPPSQMVQFRIRKKDGSGAWVEHACQTVSGPEGAFLGIRANNRDITLRRISEMESQRLREELARVTRITTAGQLSASLAHELSQPLAAIRCNALAAEQLLTSGAMDLHEIRAALKDIQADSERAGRVIQRLRAWFKKSSHARNALQVNDVVQETVGLLHSELVLKGITLQLALDPLLPEVWGNRVELQQVVLNLAMNALEAMAHLEPGQRLLRISTWRGDSARVHTAVHDCGSGIPEAMRNRLFEPFVTTKSAGMGMGLAISQTIIEAHGGRLRAKNNPDRGATFEIILPAYDGATA